MRGGSGRALLRGIADRIFWLAATPLVVAAKALLMLAPIPDDDADPDQVDP